MGDVFGELKEHEKKITEIIKEEEASFCKTLAKVRADLKFRLTSPLVIQFFILALLLVKIMI